MNATTLQSETARAAGQLRSPLDHDAAAGSRSAVSWGAIFAGAAGAAALSLILLILGTGLGLSSVSPWSGQGVNATTFGVSTVVWLTFTQLAASGMGGYLAGRLRTRWAGAHTDEVYFRDTAHGFLAWAVASLATAAMLTSVIGSLVSNVAQAGATVAGGTVAAAAAAAGPAAASAVQGDAKGGAGGSAAYFVDSLFRRDTGAAGTAAAPAGATTTNTAAAAPLAGSMSTGSTAAPSQMTGTGSDPADLDRASGEMGRILANGAASGTLSPEDTRYAGQVIAQRTGLSQADAEKRVSDTFARIQAKAKYAEGAARDAADQARKASSYASLWLFVTMLIGAFIASLCATMGGRRRDMI